MIVVAALGKTPRFTLPVFLVGLSSQLPVGEIGRVREWGRVREREWEIGRVR